MNDTTLLGWLQQHAKGNRRLELEDGQALFEQGDPARAAYVIDTGRVVVLRDGVALSELGPGASLGEASVFLEGDDRSASVVSVGRTCLWMLPQSEVAQLRASPGPAYDELLGAGLGETLRRLDRVNEDLVTRAAHEGLPSAAWPRFDPTAAAPGEPDRERALSRVPVLCWTSTQLREQLGAAMQASHVPAGRALFLEGDPGDAVHVLASGGICLRRRAGSVDQRLAELGPGSVFGASGYIAGQDRGFSAVATEPSWVLSLDRRVAEELPLEARRRFGEALLAVMRQQLQAVNLASRELRHPERDFRALISAVGHLDGWRAGAPLTRVRVDQLAAPPPVEAPDPDQEQLFGLIRSSIIGEDRALETPFGLRRIVYADYTASGRSLSFIEDFLRDKVMPTYANTHSESSASGLQTTRFREEARQRVADSVGAGPEHSVIFVGSGATGAINKLIDLLALRRPPAPPGGEEPPRPPPERRPVVFVGLYEHHSNLLPWRHSHADLVTIGLDASGRLDTEALRRGLEQHADRPLRIGSFSAGSNVTGVATDVPAVTRLLKEHGALSFWDYAAAAPYVPIDVGDIDALFLSPHKFIGGPGTPGVLVVRTALAQHAVPTHPGGGTVEFVTSDVSVYLDDLTHREEAGTPAILESVRCGLVFQLKDRVGAHAIHAMERRLVRSAITAWSRNPAIRILGPLDAERLSIVSFMVRHGRGFLHYDFVVALLNDLFGIQSRGGCSCAGPYGYVLLGLDSNVGDALMELTHCGYGSLKPGWTRVNFNYFISPREHAFIVQAVNLVAAHGHALLPRYRFESTTGRWTHQDGNPYRPASLADLRLDGGEASWDRSESRLPEEALDRVLEEGRRILEDAARAAPTVSEPELEARFERWRWFPLPHEAAAWLRHHNDERGPEFSPPLLAGDTPRRGG